ncbi:trypsin-like peptidase domain-containing protein [Streptomyces sp. TLI_146]|uniref:nSTAND1 domain-containing NTPase n=1 Tax=Streptomyces sp. TLI_146 TaxID=1938858 RepID=UPI000C706C66|nr:trypsin-like peptidase domain-containing protein [Streptomyces sp. TLI_146]PKV77027.1 trypsin-like peptidase [Streptomyces sp. TLI_146]
MTGAQARSADEVLASTVVRIAGRGGAVCGAGALVAPDLVVTCAHVVSDALGRPRQETVAAGAVLTVDFPLAGTGASGTGANAAAEAETGAGHDDPPAPPPARPPTTATVEHWIPTRPDRTGDIAVLRLPEPVPGTSPLPMADPDTVWEHGARAVGFTGGEPGEMWFRGRFSGATSEGWIQLSRADGQSAHVRRGFSGTPVWDNELGAAVGLVVAAQPEQDAQQAFVLSTRTLLREVPALAAVLSPAPPFRGLATFQESDADVYFGRDDDIEEVVRALRGEHRTVTLYGPSGSGKSSLALAGVAPRMRQAGYDVLVVNAGRIASPRAAIATELYERIRSGSYGLPARASSADQVETWLASLGLADALHRATGSPSGRLLIVLDQAEALLDRTDDELAQAADLLFPAHPAPGSRVLLTLRSDFMDATLKHPRLGPALRSGATLPLTPMSRDQLREVVVRPLEQVPAVAYDPGLERRILDDAGGEPGILPLLGFVLEQLWERRASGRLRSAAYEEMGGVRGALELHSERAWREIVRPGREEEGTEGERAAVEGTEAEALRLLTGLVRVHPGSDTPLRRRLTRQEAGEERWALARAFAERRLLVLHGGEEEPQTAELAHEALVTAWPALRRQVRADAEFLAGRAELVHDRRRWERGGRRADLLPGPRQLAATEHWLGGRERELSEREREFLALARRRHRARRTRLRAAWTAAALVLALIAGLGTFLVYQSHVSDQRRAEARSRALASMSRDLTTTDPGQAALAAIAAYDIAPTQEARSALLRRYDQFKDADWVLTGVQGKIDAVAMSPDGAVTLVTTKEGRATLYVRARGRVLRTPLRLPDKARGPMVSRDGRRIAYLGAKDGTLFWHDVDPAARDAEHLLTSTGRIDGEGAFKAVGGLFAGSAGMAALSPSGARAVAVDDGGRLWLWDLRTKTRRQLLPSGPKTEAVWYGPDENTLVTQRPGPSPQESTMVAVDIATGRTRQLAERAYTDSRLAQLGLSGDGGVLVVCQAGATVSTPVYQAVRVADGRRIHRHTADAPCHGLAIDRTGERYAVHQGGGWHLVDTRPGREVKPLFGPRVTSLSNMRLLGRELALTMAAWEETAVTGWSLGMDTTHIPTTPVLLDSGDKMLAHVGSKGEQLVLMDTTEESFDGPGPPRRLAEVARDPATDPQQLSDLKINRAETLLADLVGRTTVMIRDTSTLRAVARISTAEPPLDTEGEPEKAEYVFTADNELVTVSGSLVEHWNARTGKRLSRPFEVGDAGISEDKHPKFRLFRHPAPGHVQVIISGDPAVHAVDLRTGSEDKALSLTLGPDVTDAGFDRSGRYAAVRTGGDMVELWSLRPGRKPEKVYGPIGPLKQFSDYRGGFVGDSSEFVLANGNSIRFVQASDPGQVRSYDFDTPQTFIAAPKDAKVLLRTGQDGRVDLLRFDPGRWRARVCEVLGRDLDPEERRSLAGGLPKRICPAPAG